LFEIKGFVAVATGGGSGNLIGHTTKSGYHGALAVYVLDLEPKSSKLEKYARLKVCDSSTKYKAYTPISNPIHMFTSEGRSFGRQLISVGDFYPVLEIEEIVG
jgi:hypothetical protein